MGVVEQSQEAVEAHLSALEDTYPSFPVNQTTVTVPTEKYERERERAHAGSVDIYTKVRNDNADVLHVESGDELVLPSARTSDGSLESAALNSVEEATGISCRIDDVEQATILGIHDTETPEDAVYRLAIVFECDPQAGTLDSNAVWHATAEVPELVAP